MQEFDNNENVIFNNNGDAELIENQPTIDDESTPGDELNAVQEIFRAGRNENAVPVHDNDAEETAANQNSKKDEVIASRSAGASNVQHVTIENNNEHQSARAAKIFSSTCVSGEHSTLGLSSLSFNLEISTGTGRIIEEQLREGALDLDAFDNTHAVASAEPQNPTGAEVSGNTCSLGSMAPNMSHPENMLDIADREITKLFNTI